MGIGGFVKTIAKRISGEVPTSTLVKRGLTVGENFTRQQGCYIDPTHCFLIEIGGEENTYEEVENTIDVISKMINYYIGVSNG